MNNNECDAGEQPFHYVDDYVEDTNLFTMYYCSGVQNGSHEGRSTKNIEIFKRLYQACRPLHILHKISPFWHWNTLVITPKHGMILQ